MKLIFVEHSGHITPVNKIEEATHVPVDLHMALLQRNLELEDLNKRLYAKLTREVKAKKKMRDRVERAALAGQKPPRARAKREIVSRRDGYYSVLVVDLDAETEHEVLEEVLDYVREANVGARVRRISDPGTGVWEAEIEVPLDPKEVIPTFAEWERTR